jgi:hypothetical protein
MADHGDEFRHIAGSVAARLDAFWNDDEVGRLNELDADDLLDTLGTVRGAHMDSLLTQLEGAHGYGIRFAREVQ